jgi:hypothetical protein
MGPTQTQPSNDVKTDAAKPKINMNLGLKGIKPDIPSLVPPSTKNEPVQQKT